MFLILGISIGRAVLEAVDGQHDQVIRARLGLVFVELDVGRPFDVARGLVVKSLVP